MTAEDAECTAEPRWAGRARGWFWSTVWLVFLIVPALSLPGLDRPTLAAAGLAGFALVYLAVARSCWNLSLDPGGRPSPVQLAGLGLVAGLGVALAAAYGGQSGSWRIVMIYVAAAGANLLPAPRATGAWLVGTVGALFAVGAGQDADLADQVILALTTILVGVIATTFRQMQDLVARLRRTRAELAEAAVSAERLRFARDLHDLLGHTLSLIVVKAEVVARVVDLPPAAAREAGEIQQIGRRALAEVREAVTGYRERSFATELDAARTALADAGLAVTVRAPDAPLPAPADRLFGWVVREAATNVVRHSHGRRCEIEVRSGNGQTTLEVRDDGVGRAAGVDGGGLRGLAERLTEAGGRLEAGAATGGGWRIAASVPVGSEP